MRGIRLLAVAIVVLLAIVLTVAVAWEREAADEPSPSIAASVWLDEPPEPAVPLVVTAEALSACGVHGPCVVDVDASGVPRVLMGKEVP